MLHKQHPQHLFVLYILVLGSFVVSVIVFFQIMMIKNTLQTQITQIATQQTLMQKSRLEAKEMESLQKDMILINDKLNQVAEMIQAGQKK
ncbi:MAG: hypothetical protein G01um101418_551 [Parcubacteria group bacterium Gr01-1014_18]|nr:MAG: hypothetical protein Greene041636_597 [Parcubacteria group bacterium Greene0416_36]TSC80934.1 MAG: hypothetical protein G01um101418_551 [Parcubacteria group bacterium Gr01-1014_18]TSC98723.1 MAG: hypothetical protein Greene101420_597 [Parcubacteria group bacterium Greene1014_20]TSD06475.1 MAG: hypothetical protein Greene07142_905 [Parcubacteria group bacterium Greene0714_2]